MPVDDAFRMDVAALRRALQEDGTSAIVVATVGTTNTGAIDPLRELAELCAERSAWLHLDAAYGAFGRLDRNLSALYEGFELADSVAVGPAQAAWRPRRLRLSARQRWLALRRTYSLVPECMPTADREVAPWRSEYGIEQTRPFQALRAWAVLRALGIDAIRARVERHNALIRQLAVWLGTPRDFVVEHAPVLSILCARYAPAQVDAARADALHRELARRVQQAGDYYVTSTQLRGRTVLRLCTVHRD